MICKKIMAAQALNDSATREFVNLWMHSIYGRMQKAYGGRGRVCHVLYTAHSCYHPAYFTLAQLVMKGAIKPEDITGPELEGGSALPIVPPVPKHFNVNICPPFLKKFLMCYDLFFKKGIRIDIDMVPDESHAGKIGLGPKDKENLKKKKKAKK